MMLRAATKVPTQKAHQENPMTASHYIGFDVHKKTISFCVKTAGRWPRFSIVLIGAPGSRPKC